MEVTLRPAYWGDVDKLYEWRVDGETNDWYEGRPVDRESHERWFRERVYSRVVTIWIAEVDGVRVGSVREDSNGELSYHVDPAWQGMGIGTEIVKQAIALSTNHRLKACVDHDNVGGAKVALAAGFERRPDVDFYLLRR